MPKLTFLGTGTSQGVPVIACECAICQSTNPLDKRLRTSAMIEMEEKTFVFDTGPDFRQQMLRANVKKLDAVLLTHLHKDHIAGLDDVRAFNYQTKAAMEVYADSITIDQLKKEYVYIFDGTDYPGIPKINIHLIENKPFTIGNIPIIPILVYHHKLPVFGFKIENIAYVTDANFIPHESKAHLYNLDVLVLNALRKTAHISHFTLDEALEIIAELKPKRAYLTHISHWMGLHSEVSKELPDNVFLATDELVVEV